MTPGVPTRRCGTCKERKLLTAFYRNRARRLGYANICKVCHRSDYRMKYRDENLVRINVRGWGCA